MIRRGVEGESGPTEGKNARARKFTYVTLYPAAVIFESFCGSRSFLPLQRPLSYNAAIFNNRLFACCDSAQNFTDTENRRGGSIGLGLGKSGLRQLRQLVAPCGNDLGTLHYNRPTPSPRSDQKHEYNIFHHPATPKLAFLAYRLNIYGSDLAAVTDRTSTRLQTLLSELGESTITVEAAWGFRVVDSVVLHHTCEPVSRFFAGRVIPTVFSAVVSFLLLNGAALLVGRAGISANAWRNHSPCSLRWNRSSL